MDPYQLAQEHLNKLRKRLEEESNQKAQLKEQYRRKLQWINSEDNELFSNVTVKQVRLLRLHIARLQILLN